MTKEHVVLFDNPIFRGVYSKYQNEQGDVVEEYGLEQKASIPDVVKELARLYQSN